MPSLWNREVESYKVDVFQSSTLNYDRSLRLNLKATSSQSAHTVSIKFPASVPGDFINIGNGFTTIEIRQTRFAGLTTDPEGTGEGFRDSDANP